MDNSTLQKACILANHVFFGDLAWIGEKPANHIIPAVVIRNAIKYAALEEQHQKIWDDPEMSPAHKYQNIPQLDMSTYLPDYVVPVEYCPFKPDPEHPTVTYVIANHQEWKMKMIQPDVWEHILEMAHIDRLMEYLDQHPDEEITYEENCMVFRSDDIVDYLSLGTPSYQTTVEDLYHAFQENGHDLFVPFRRGWSQVLNVRPYEYGAERVHFHILYEGEEAAHLMDTSSITFWDGTSMRIESHGVEVEDMTVLPISHLDCMQFKMRQFHGTHEYIRDVEIRAQKPQGTFYAIYTRKGINVNGFEFNMP